LTLHERGKVIQKAFAFTSHTDKERCLLREKRLAERFACELLGLAHG